MAFPGIVTGQDLVEKSLADLISESTAVAIVGGLVLILAALGIVAVVGFMVATRTRELIPASDRRRETRRPATAPPLDRFGTGPGQHRWSRES